MEEKGVDVASAGIGALAVSVRLHEHSAVILRQAFDGVFIRQAFPFWSLSRHEGHFRCSGLCWASPFGVLENFFTSIFLGLDYSLDKRHQNCVWPFP